MNRISHRGVVETIEGDRIEVRFTQTSACAACHVAGHCSAAESREKVVSVIARSAAKSHAVGDEVTVAMTADNGRRAVMLAFVLPFVLMVSVLSLCLWLTRREDVAALAGVGSLAPYYFILYLCRGRLARHFAFVIEE